MRIYLDTCSIQRPLDTLGQLRIRLEAEAVLGVLEWIESRQVELISSTVLELELERNSLSVRREHGAQVLGQAVLVVSVDKSIEQRAAQFVANGIKPMDALHIAAAESGRADVLCTCDDQLLRRTKGIRDLQLRVLSPLELIEVIDNAS